MIPLSKNKQRSVFHPFQYCMRHVQEMGERIADTPEYKALSSGDQSVIDILAEQTIPFVEAELVQWEDENGITICVEKA